MAPSDLCIYASADGLDVAFFSLVAFDWCISVVSRPSHAGAMSLTGMAGSLIVLGKEQLSTKTFVHGKLHNSNPLYGVEHM